MLKRVVLLKYLHEESVLSKLTPDIHRRFHIRPPLVKYKPDSVKNILDRIWRLTNISIDLAFYAYFARDHELALRILELDKTIVENIGQFVMHNSMAFRRSREGGYASLLSFYYSSAIDTISDSVKDIVYTLLIGYTPRLRYAQILPYIDGEIIAKLRVDRDLKVLELTDKYPVDIIVIVNGDRYKFAPRQDENVHKGSVLYVRGFKENVMRLLADHGVEYSFEDLEIPELEQVIKSIVNIKDCTILMLDLAHYVLMEHSPELMEEVEDLEIYIDWRHMETMDQLRSLANKIDPDTFMGLITLLKELEDIADASNTISYIPGLQEEFPEEYRELFSKIFESFGEKVKTVTISRDVNLGGLEHYLRKYGGTILAIRTRDTWIAYPFARDMALRPGDRVIIVYQEEFSDEIERLLRTKV
ncbi:MAG: potassium transporter TrkA [Desulfurococcaceae archaeon]